jgi:hypothetical protein
VTSPNPLADRLLDDARKKTAREENPGLAKVAMIVGIVGLLASPVSIVGWVLGGAAIGTGLPGLRQPGSAARSKVAVLAGGVAVLVGTFFFARYVANN